MPRPEIATLMATSCLCLGSPSKRQSRALTFPHHPKLKTVMFQCEMHLWERRHCPHLVQTHQRSKKLSSQQLPQLTYLALEEVNWLEFCHALLGLLSFIPRQASLQEKHESDLMTDQIQISQFLKGYAHRHNKYREQGFV